MGFVGLFVALVGQDGIHAHNRFTFDINGLAGGFSLIPMLVGAFGFAEVLTAMKDKMALPALRAFDSVLRALATFCAIGRPCSARASSRLRRNSTGRRRGHGGVVVLRGGATPARRANSSARARSRA